MQTLLAIANAAAGSSDDESVEVAVAALRKAYDVEVVTTSTPEELDEALAAHPDLHGVVVLGGDGSLHAVIAALRTAERLDSVIVGLVPLGTGNDFAATLGLPDDPALAAGVIVADHARADRPDHRRQRRGRRQRRAHRHRRRSSDRRPPAEEVPRTVGYVAGALIASVKGIATPGAKLHITVDGEPLFPHGSVIQLAVGNGRFVGGGAALLPEADPSDGTPRPDGHVRGPPPPPHRVRLEAQQGHAARARPTSSTARARTSRSHGDPLPCTSDGELTEPATEHSWRIEPGAVRMWR